MRMFARFAAIFTGAVLAVAGLSTPALATDVSLRGGAQCLESGGWAASWTLKNHTGKAITVKVVYAGQSVALTGDLAAGVVLDDGDSATATATLPSTQKSVTLAVGYVLGGTTVVLYTDDKSQQSRKHWVRKKVYQCKCPTTPPTTAPTTSPTTSAPTTQPTTAAPTTSAPPSTTRPAEPTASQTETEPAGAALPLTGPSGPVIAGVAVLLLAAGVGMVVLVRRRRTRFVV